MNMNRPIKVFISGSQFDNDVPDICSTSMLIIGLANTSHNECYVQYSCIEKTPSLEKTGLIIHCYPI